MYWCSGWCVLWVVIAQVPNCLIVVVPLSLMKSWRFFELQCSWVVRKPILGWAEPWKIKYSFRPISGYQQFPKTAYRLVEVNQFFLSSAVVCGHTQVWEFQLRLQKLSSRQASFIRLHGSDSTSRPNVLTDSLKHVLAVPVVRNAILFPTEWLFIVVGQAYDLSKSYVWRGANCPNDAKSKG